MPVSFKVRPCLVLCVAFVIKKKKVFEILDRDKRRCTDRFVIKSKTQENFPYPIKVLKFQT